MHRALPVFRRSGNAASIIAPHSPPFMGLRCMSLFVHDWHNENFMESEPLEAKQKWLSDLQTSHPSVVDVEAHLVVLRGIVNSLKPGSPQRAEEYVFSHLSGFEPTDECYEALLEAWSKSPKEDSSLCVLRAKRWFDKIKAPTLQSYHLLLDVVSKGRVKRSNRARAFSITEDNAKETEKILEAMVSPNTNTYNYVLRAWSKVLNPELSLRKVVHWLSKMEQLQQENPSGCIQPNTKSYAIAMQAYAVFAVYRAKAGKGEGREELEQIEALLKYMQELKNDGFQEIEPNTVAYNILISAHARLSQFPQHQDAPLEAEKVLRRMMAIGNSVYPDHLSFSKVILAWSNSKRPTSGKRAAYWLSKLWELYEASNRNESLRPTVNTYNVVLKAWQNDPKNMEKVFVEMLRIERSEENNNLFLRPNSESFALMIHAWVKVDVSRAVMWLEELMQREKDSTTEWSVTTVPDLFQVIVKNAARDPSVDNLVLGLKVFDYYRSSRHPLDAMSYVWLLELGLKTFSKQENDRDRREFVFDTVNDCCSDGLMSASFVKKLSNGNTYYEGWTIEESRDTVAEIFNHWPLPSSWSRNVPKEQHVKESDLKRHNFEILPFPL